MWFAAILVKPVTINARRGLILYAHQSNLKIYSQSAWEDLQIKELGINDQKRIDYFADKVCRPTCSKLIQVNNVDVMVIGGTKYKPSLLTRDYDVMRSCLKLNLVTGRVTLMTPMVRGRSHSHSICLAANCVYVVGGKNENVEIEKKCDRYLI